MGNGQLAMGNGSGSKGIGLGSMGMNVQWSMGMNVQWAMGKNGQEWADSMFNLCNWVSLSERYKLEIAAMYMISSPRKYEDIRIATLQFKREIAVGRK
jgi:hypothetical protein